MKSLLLFLFISSPLFGQRSIIPHPAIMQSKRGEFVVRAGLRVWVSASCLSEQIFLKTYWQEAGLPVLSTTAKAKSANVLLLVDTARREALGLEGYELIVSVKRITIAGASATGVFYGLQTLRQLLPNGIDSPMQGIRILDKPRFGWRSFRLEEGRSGKGIVAMKRLLDELALLKLNRFQWQPSNGLYTQQQIREMVRYAEERHITITLEKRGLSNSVVPAHPPSAKQVIYFRKSDPRETLKTAKLGHDLVITISENSLNSEISVDKLYLTEPIPEQMPEDLRPQILGVDYEFLDAETTSSAKKPDQLQRELAALAEVAWTFAQNKDLTRFKAGLREFEMQWFVN